MSCSPSDSTLFKDFEVLWLNEATGYPKDMSGVTLEIYHYESSKKASITSVFKEPYIFTETINDQVNIGSVLASENVYIDVHFELELNLINTNLEDLECPPNDFVVPGTNRKVAIVNGYKKYALSACELAALVNINASGYTACAENGFIILKSDYDGSESYLQVGDATWNQTIGLVEGSQFFGQDLLKVYDLEPTPMFRVNVGNYVYTNFEISSPPFEKNKRYFVLYRGVDLISDITELKQENFIIYDKSKKTGINYSILSETDILSSGISVEYAQMCAMGNFPIGARGPQGFTGASGGEQGHTGVQGIRGFTGIQGIQGNTGIRGETGTQGIQGETGTQGIQGNTGIQGETGFGIQGIQGFTGQMGIQGLRGVTGIQGDTGLGVQGVIGDMGETGIQGVTGLPLTNIPQVLKSSSYILQSSDTGKHIAISSGGITINSDIFNIGDTVTIFNNSSSDQVITQGTSVILRLAGTPLTGNRTLAQYGLCTTLCIVGGSNPVFVISGGGLT